MSGEKLLILKRKKVGNKNMIEAMKRKAYRLLDYVARIINTWDIEGDFVSYLNNKINKDHND